MKFVSCTVLMAALLSTLAGVARAQIVWQTPQSISGVSDISTLGTYVDAIGVNDFGGAITIGDTTFNPFFSDSGITQSGVGGGSDGSGMTSPPYLKVLDGVGYVGFTEIPQTGTITLNNLVSGDEYQVEVWNDGTRPTPIIGSNTVILAQQYVLGTFTAGNSPETFTWQNEPGNAGEINAVALRLIPEPSTYAMMIGGLALLGFCLRRKAAVLI